MYRIDWSAFATAALLRELAGAASVADPDVTPALLDTMSPLVTRVLRATGGLPVVERRPTAAERDARARALLAEALARTLRGPVVRESDDADGYVLRPSADAPADATVARVERLPVNAATAAQLTALGVGPAIGRRVVEERRAHGAFATLRDLDDRVRGVGPAAVDRVAHALRFDAPDALPAGAVRATGDLATDLATLAARQDGEQPATRLLAALDVLATTTAGDPHPATRDRRRRLPIPPLVPAAEATEWIAPLFGTAYYYRLAALFDAAVTSIDVCMFHVAMPGTSHPTVRLLDALGRARARGLRVRVLMDQDRESDPYRSTVINTPARTYLRARRVAVRFDRSDTLLHSKLVLIDGARVVLGSHNWSAGSYFQFDDLSLVLQSPALGAQLGARFRALWADGS